MSAIEKAIACLRGSEVPAITIAVYKDALCPSEGRLVCRVSVSTEEGGMKSCSGSYEDMMRFLDENLKPLIGHAERRPVYAGEAK